MKKKLIAPLVSLATLIMAAPAVMAQDDPNTEGLHLRALLGVEHDSNVLRVPAGAGRISDTAIIGGVGLSFNKRYGLQRVRADIEADTYRYQDQTSLNYNTINYSLAWDWQFTPRFTGVVSADRRQYRDVTTDPLLLTNRVGRRTERNELAEGGFQIAGPWRVVAGLAHSRSESTEPLSWDASPDITSWYAGGAYEFPSGSSFSARYRRGDGEYKDQSFSVVNRKFRDFEPEVTMHWALTGKTIVDARLAHRKREHDGAPQLDFSGMVGSANVVYDLTGKTRVVAGLARDISASGFTTGGHVDSDRIFIAPVWHWTPKTSFSLRWDHTTRHWNDVALVSGSAGRKETLESVQVGADWAALRTITLSPYVRSERLSSSIGTGYRATVYGLTAKAQF